MEDLVYALYNIIFKGLMKMNHSYTQVGNIYIAPPRMLSQ